jgi:signal transduction histidine kinase
MPPTAWSTQQLAEFLASVSASESEASAALAAVERAAEALDAEVASIVCRGELVAAVGYPEGAAPLADLESVVPGAAGCELTVPGAGLCPASAVALEHPPGGRLVLARSGPGGLSPEEAALLRGMARVTALTMRMLRLLDDERAAREELRASRVRIVAASDEARRRIERDLHDGIQQRLVTLALELRALEQGVPPEQPELLVQLSHLKEGLKGALEELREISRGVHPAILSEGGLGPALKSLARRCSLPVELDLRLVDRLPEPVEVAAYYVVSEALANAVKHADASVARVNVEARDGTLHLSIRDDGIGGADPRRGSGILGLTDRVEALGGTIAVRSPAGEGTSMIVQLPIELP